jgi:RHS repeat-associated protein
VGYTFDPANRVTAACAGASNCAGPVSGRVVYTYDHVGNMLSRSRTGSFGGDTTRYSYDNADELTRSFTGNQRVDYGYDGQGNQTRAGSDVFTYNLDRTIASATVNGVKTTYTYDASGLELSAVSTVSGRPRSRSWSTDVNAALPQRDIETTATPDTSTSRGFLAGPGGVPLALLTGGQVHPYLPDWLGGVADLVSPEAASQRSYDYDPFGNPRTGGTASQAQSALDNPIGYAGEYLDPTLDNRYLTASRAYDPDTARFDSTDPLPPVTGIPATTSRQTSEVRG